MEDLRVRLARGEQSAFADLYDLYSGRIYRYLAVRLGSPDDAADVLQEVFVRIARGREGLRRGEGDLTGYIFTIARNEAMRLLAKRSRQPDADLNLIAETGSAGNSERSENADAVQFALRSLSDAQCEVVTMKIYGGLTFGEIAATTGLPQGTVATRYRAALARMRELLARNES